jgi:hypothetical protein
MEYLLEQGFIGIVTGIITTAVLFLIKELWVTKATPFIAATRYQGVLINGQWQGTSENKDPEQGHVFSNSSQLFLDQKAHQLTGLFIFNFSNDSKTFTLEFNVTGYIWEGYVTLNFTPKDRRVTSYGTALLKLHNGGNTLQGEWLFRNVETEFVNQSPLYLGRELQSS